jgi:hypothetical protein
LEPRRSFREANAGKEAGRPIHQLLSTHDKSLREYDAARAELLNHLSVDHQLLVTPYLRAIDQMENCFSAAHRAVLNAKALRARRIGGGAPRLTTLQEQRLAYFRNAVEHSDERVLGTMQNKKSSRLGGSSRSESDLPIHP